MFERLDKMVIIMKIIKKSFQFLRHLSQEHTHPCFYAPEMRKAQRKKEQTCCEAREVVRWNV